MPMIVPFRLSAIYICYPESFKLKLTNTVIPSK